MQDKVLPSAAIGLAGIFLLVQYSINFLNEILKILFSLISFGISESLKIYLKKNSLNIGTFGYKNLLSTFSRYKHLSLTLLQSKIGIPNEYFSEGIDEQVEKKVKEAIKKLNNFFGKFPDTKIPIKKITIEKQKLPQLLLNYKKTDQAHMALGVRAFNAFSDKRYTLAVLSNILGGNMSSRLFTEIREKRGMAYYIRTMAEEYTDVGFLVAHAGIDNKRVEEAIKIILKECRKLTERKVPKDELKKAKENIKGRLYLSLETSDACAAYFGEQEILKGQIDSPEKECAMIDKVSQNDILKVAKEIFKPEKLNLALIGPFKDKEKFQKLLKL